MHVGFPPITVKDGSRILRSVRDRFRCPDEFLSYCLSGTLSHDSEFFYLPSGDACYGRSVRAAERTPRASYSIESEIASPAHCNPLVLDFDPDEVIDNLRLERYPGCRLVGFEKALKSVYYQLRPLTGRKVRSFIQRLRAAGGKKNRFPNWPVDTTVESICDALLLSAMQANGIESVPFIWFWPNGAPACIVMTHDVETVVGRNFCAELMDIDDSFGIRSSFQIVPQERYIVPQDFLEQFGERGFEVCVQDLNHDGRLFDDPGAFHARAALINHYAQEFGALGFRSAVLYRKPEWLEHLNFSFDMSMPNVAHLDPQRGGCCTVTPYFIGQVLELPLTTIQDYTLFHILKDRSLELWTLQLDLILAKNGLASFLVHPDYIMEPETREVYQGLLAMLNEVRTRPRAWFALPREVDEWWRARAGMTVVRDGSSWRITGEGAERAVLAFARIVGGQLVYEFGNEQVTAEANQDAPALPA